MNIVIAMWVLKQSIIYKYFKMLIKINVYKASYIMVIIFMRTSPEITHIKFVVGYH